MRVNAINSYNSSRNHVKNQRNVAFSALAFPFARRNAILKAIDNANTIDIYVHAFADDDAANACKVMAEFFKSRGKKVNICIGRKGMKTLFSKFRTRKTQTDAPADLTFIVDFNAQERIPSSFRHIFYQNPREKIIGLDHHTQAQDYVNGNIYCDPTARSCCGIVYRFLESIAMDDKISKKNLQRLYCGMLSDYTKAELITVGNNKLKKLETLNADANSKYVLEKIEAQLSEEQKAEVYRHLDVMSNLTQAEKAFRRQLISGIKTSPNGKLAYVEIDPHDKYWTKLGMDSYRTSTILRDLRVRLIEGVQHDNLFTDKQKEQLKNIEGAIIFYRVQRSKGDLYQMSLHTKGNYATRLITEARKLWYAKTATTHFEAGGHDNRAGGRISSYTQEDADKYVKCFVDAAENLDRQTI